MLSEHPGGWYYKSNHGDGRFGPIRQVAPHTTSPSLGSRHKFMDLAGDGDIDVVDFVVAPASTNVTTTRVGSAYPLPVSPTSTGRDPNMRFVDLTGDGRRRGDHRR